MTDTEPLVDPGAPSPESVYEARQRERSSTRVSNRTLALIAVAVIMSVLLAFLATAVVWTVRTDERARAEAAEQDAEAARMEAQAARAETQCRAEYNVAVVQTKGEVDIATAARNVAQDRLVAALGGVAPAGEPPLDVGAAFANLGVASDKVAIALGHYQTAIDEYATAVESECSTPPSATG